jgi:hypothetical protein
VAALVLVLVGDIDSGDALIPSRFRFRFGWV